MDKRVPEDTCSQILRSTSIDCSVWEHQNFPCVKLIEIVILFVYYTILFGFSLVRHFIISVRDCTPSLWKHYMSCTNLHWPYILLMLDLPEHRLQGIILDISSNRLFKAVRVCDSIETKNRPFLKIKFANKGIDALNLSNILNQKSVQSNIPPYFEYKESPCISYSYTCSVATKIFNYKTSLQQIDFQSLSQNPLPCSCSGSEFRYAPCGHIVTGDLNIVRNDKLRDLLRKGPKI